MVQAWHLLLSAGLVIAVLTRPAEAGEPAPGYVGSAQCGTCHKPEYQKQSNTHHAQALTPILQSSVAAKLIGRTVREKSGVAFEYTEVPDGIAVTTILGKTRSSAVLRWAFGAGVRGITPVGLVDGKYVEHRVSWYPAENRAGLTMGHSTAPTSAHAALGLSQLPDVIYRCFNCHATAVKAWSGPVGYAPRNRVRAMPRARPRTHPTTLGENHQQSGPAFSTRFGRELWTMPSCSVFNPLGFSRGDR